MEFIDATTLHMKSGGPKWRDLRLAALPILPDKGPGATNPKSNPTQSDFAMPGRNTRLSNKLNPTESTNS
jgi:hypothetical protein